MGCCLGGSGNVFELLADRALIVIAMLAGLLWLMGSRQDWLCGYGLLLLSLFSMTLWKVLQELRLRQRVERTAIELEAQNTELRSSVAQLGSDLDMLKDTIGAIGDKGDDWIGQLRFLWHAQQRENDRHSMLLRGHARIVLLQLIQHFDSDHSMRLNTGELKAAEAFLTAGAQSPVHKHISRSGHVSTQQGGRCRHILALPTIPYSHRPIGCALLNAGFPEINIRHLEDKAAAGGVTIADLEPLLLSHLEGQQGGPIIQLEVQQPRAQAMLLQA